jgi:long-subunit fatty acid transport protein
MKNTALLTVLFCLLITTIKAQNFSDALRYSQLDRIGTARSLGVGQANTSIPTNFDVLSTNPAGLAVFRKSEFQISPALTFFSSETNLANGNTNQIEKEEKTTFQLPSLGFISVSKPLDKHWKQVNFALGINRLANFNRNIEFSGDQAGSISHDFVERSIGYHPDDLDAFAAGPAYDAYVTAWDEDNDDYYTDLDLEEVISKYQSIKEKGGIDELSIGVAGNLDEQLLLGLSLGIPFIHYERESTYTEMADHSIFRRLDVEEELEVVGAGINIKGGLTLRIDRKLHIGLAIHSPSWYSIEEDFESEVIYDYKYEGNEDIFPEAGPKSGLSPLGEFEYSLRTPWRAMGGLGLIVGKAGFISADVEYVDYKSAKFNFDDPVDRELERDLNRDIDDNLRAAISLRFGGEVALEQIRLRAGLGYGQSALEEDEGFTDKSIHAGIGYRANKFYLDMGYRYADKEFSYSPYTLSQGITPLVNSEYTNHDLVLTIGVIF